MAWLYIALYILAAGTLLTIALSPSLMGSLSAYAKIGALLVTLFLLTLLVREIKKGVFDVIIIEPENIVLSRFGKKAHLSWVKAESVDIKTYKSQRNDKFIIVSFVKNAKGEGFELKADFRQGLYDSLLEAFHARRK